MSGARGFTLIEVLASVALTTLLAVAAWSWLAASARSGERLRRELASQEEATALARLLQDDLAGVPPGWPPHREGEHSLVFRTLATVPGQAASGLREVRWTWTAAEGIVRSDGDRRQVLTERLGFQVLRDEDPPQRWWLRVATADRMTQAGSGWAFPLERR